MKFIITILSVHKHYNLGNQLTTIKHQLETDFGKMDPNTYVIQYIYRCIYISMYAHVFTEYFLHSLETSAMDSTQSHEI